jgi:formate dehydrogenase major subunit
LGPPDESGRRRPVPVEGTNYVINTDWIIAAIGQKPDLEFAGKDHKLVQIKQTKWGTLEVRKDVMETNIPGVFAGGDVVLGAATAIEAIADGRKAAEVIHKYLTGQKLDIPKHPFMSRKDNFKKLSTSDFTEVAKTVRAKMSVRDARERRKDWNEIELGFTPEQVFNEAIRCLECGCQAFYECDLQKHSTEYETNQNNYLGEFHDIKPDNSHPFIQIELNKCILCGRCVRICDEVVGLGIYGFIKRGFDTKVKPILGMPLAETNCISCGQCVETCPTGAIVDKVDATKPGPWILKKYPTLCQYCSIGCRMQADVLEGRVLKISADKSATVNEYGNLCSQGRYGFRYVNDPQRLKTPLIRKNGELTAVTWDEALLFTKKKIKDLQTSKSEWAVFSSPHTTNEENYLLQKFARTVLKTNNLGSFSNLNELPEPLLRASMSNTTFQKIENSDFIMVCNLDPMETHPVLYIKLQKANRRGQTIYMGSYPESRLAKKSNGLNISDDKKVLFLQYLVDRISHSEWYNQVVAPTRQEKAETLFASVVGISRRINLKEFNLDKREFDRFFKRLLSAKQPLFICHRDVANPEIIHWLNALGFVLGQSESFLAVTSSSNYQGSLDMGILAEYLPGYQKVDYPEVNQRIGHIWGTEIPPKVGLAAWDSYQNINSGNIKGMIFWQQDPVGTSQLVLAPAVDSFMIVADMFLTETAKMANVVFPLGSYFESEGSVTNAESRIQNLIPVIKSLTGKFNWQIISDLLTQFNPAKKYRNIEEIVHEIQLIVPEYKKEIALFRNGYIPNQTLLKDAKSRQVKFGANYLEKWVVDRSQIYKDPKIKTEKLVKV